MRRSEKEGVGGGHRRRSLRAERREEGARGARRLHAAAAHPAKPRAAEDWRRPCRNALGAPFRAGCAREPFPPDRRDDGRSPRRGDGVAPRSRAGNDSGRCGRLLRGRGDAAAPARERSRPQKRTAPPKRDRGGAPSARRLRRSARARSGSDGPQRDDGRQRAADGAGPSSRVPRRKRGARARPIDANRARRWRRGSVRTNLALRQAASARLARSGSGLSAAR